MKVLVIGGMHGNEPLGIDLVKKIRDSPLANVETLIANKNALENNVRFLEEDLNRSFPGDINSQVYELKRPAEILKVANEFDIVLDFHNTHCPDNDCGFIGNSAREGIAGVAEYLGLRRLVVADYDCINKYVNNCLSVEISLHSTQNDTELWYRKVKELATLDSYPKTENLEYYRFIYRLTLDDKIKYDLKEENLSAFKTIDKKLSVKLGMDDEVAPIFINDAYTPYNYGGLVQKITKK